MAKGRENIIGKGFDKNPQNINMNGRPKTVSFKAEYEELLNKDGKITFSGDTVIDIGTKGNGDRFAVLKLPTKQSLALKFLSIAMSKNESNAMRAIEYLDIKFDGKPTQNIELDINNKQQYDLTKLSNKQLAQFLELAGICMIEE